MPASFAHAFDLLFTEPAATERICRKLLAEKEDPSVALLLAGALRLKGDSAAAHAIARAVAKAHPNWAGPHFELAMALGSMGRHADALDALAQVERLGGAPGLWREVGDQHWAMGAKAAAERAYLRHLQSQQAETLVHQAGTALRANVPAVAEAALRRQLAYFPGDVLALRLLAELLSAADRYDEAAVLLRRCLDRVPSFALARYGLAMVLFHSHDLPPALEQLELLLVHDPERLEYLNLKAEALARLGDFEAAAACLARVVALHPNLGAAWSHYGNMLRTLGRREECEAAYRRAIELDAQVGEAYWGLANLKTFKFLSADIEAMREHARKRTSEDAASLLFALGKAYEDEGAYDQAFSTYSEANALRRQRFPHDRDAWSETTRLARSTFAPEFFSQRQGSGSNAKDPIFVVGMPRSGSTLVEQILASHSSVEGTMELLELLLIGRRLGRESAYPQLLTSLDPREFRRLGEEYIERTRPFRRTTTPRFVDKMPNNFMQVGLIQLILPGARIIDVRRHPLACGVSIFKQHWATGQTFAYDLEDIGAYYRDYVELMAHFDAVLPGRVHRVQYEDLVANPEPEIRRLLAACDLPFEEQCLRFYENKRAVRTPSSEQVRMPIFSAGLDNWRPFEPWLDPLKQALGPVLTSYPYPPSR